MASHAILVLCLVLPLAISPWGFDDAYYLKETVLLVAGGVLLFGEAIGLWRGRSQWVNLPMPLLLFLAFALASGWQAANVWAFGFRIALLVAGVVVFVGVARSASLPGRAAAWLTALCVSAVLATAYGILQRFGLGPFLAPDSRFVATFGNPHLYAEFIAPLLPAALCLVLVARGAREVAIALAGLGFLFGGLLWARARGPAFAVAAALIFILWALWKTSPDLVRTRQKQVWMCGGVLATVTVLMVLTGNVVVWKGWDAPSAPHPSRRVAAITPARPARMGDAGVDFRLALYRDTLAMIRERPFAGFGLGNFRIAYRAYGKALAATFPEVYPVGHVHNDVLEVAAELGLGAAVVFIWMFLGFVRASVTSARGAAREDAWPRLAAGAGLVALGINSLFAFGFYDPATALELWVFAGVAVAPKGEASLIEDGILQRSKKLWRGAAILLSGLGLGIACLGISSEVADTYVNRGLERYYTGRLAEAVAPLATAARLEVDRTEGQVMLAQAQLELGEPGSALAAMREALRLEPYNAQLHYLRGVALTRLGRLEEGRRAQGQALALYPSFSLPHLALGELAEGLGDDARARVEYESALRINPARAEARDALALLAVKGGNVDEAIRLWEEGAHLDPGDATTAHNLALAYGRKGDAKQAALWRTRATALRARVR